MEPSDFKISISSESYDEKTSEKYRNSTLQKFAWYQNYDIISPLGAIIIIIKASYRKYHADIEKITDVWKKWLSIKNYEGIVKNTKYKNDAGHYIDKPMWFVGQKKLRISLSNYTDNNRVF